MSRLGHRPGPVVLAVALALPGCGESPPDRPPRADTIATAEHREASAPSSRSREVRLAGNPPTTIPVAGPLPEHAGMEDPAPWQVDSTMGATRTGDEFNGEDLPPWLVEQLHDPDPAVRIQALETWAKRPGEALDPLTRPLVDPDEAVRARAQALLEQELDRR